MPWPPILCRWHRGALHTHKRRLSPAAARQPESLRLQVADAAAFNPQTPMMVGMWVVQVGLLCVAVAVHKDPKDGKSLLEPLL